MERLSGSNAVYLEQVTEDWGETTVNWNNQPISTTTAATWIPESSSTTENLSIDITYLVNNWVNFPEENYGLKMILENELKYRSRTYASSEHSNSSIRPKLVIELNDLSSSSGCSTPEMDTTAFMDLPYIHNNQYLYDLLDSIGLTSGGARLLTETENVKFRIPIKFWIYRDDAGNASPNITDADLRMLIIRLNQLQRDNNTGIRYYQSLLTD